MQVKFNTGSQDISLIIDESEFLDITKERTKDFWAKTIKATSHEAEAHFFLAHTIKTLPGMDKLDGGIELKLPEELGDAYLINLLPEGVDYLKLHRECSSRYLGGSKLMVIIKNV